MQNNPMNKKENVTIFCSPQQFLPEAYEKEGNKYNPVLIPDGFYLIGDSTHSKDQKVKDWLASIIDSVRQVTHMAPTDVNGKIMGHRPSQEAVILLWSHGLNLCTTVTGARYTTSTEVYPDSAGMTDTQCNNAQVAAVVGALDFVIKKNE